MNILNQLKAAKVAVSVTTPSFNASGLWSSASVETASSSQPKTLLTGLLAGATPPRQNSFERKKNMYSNVPLYRTGSAHGPMVTEPV